MRRAPEYSYYDLVTWFAGSYFSLRALWPEHESVDFIRSAPRLQVPVWFLVGRRDYNTPFELVETGSDQVPSSPARIALLSSFAYFSTGTRLGD